MNVVSSCVGERRINTILDLGCGTGRFSEALAAHFEAEVIGIDPSKKMLEQARGKLRDHRVRYELGHAEAIPLADDSVDLVFMSMIFHHLDDPALAARECRRVLRDGAPAFLRTGTRERIPSYPYVDFFPKSRPILNDCLPTGAYMREVFESAGFSTVASNVVVQEIAPDYPAYIEKVLAGADSVLARLTRSDFEPASRRCAPTRPAPANGWSASQSTFLFFASRCRAGFVRLKNSTLLSSYCASQTSFRNCEFNISGAT